MRKISNRLSKLEIKQVPASRETTVMRHIVTGVTEVERQAKIEALTETSPNHVLHVIRTIIPSNRESQTPCPA